MKDCRMSIKKIQMHNYWHQPECCTLSYSGLKITFKKLKPKNLKHLNLVQSLILCIWISPNTSEYKEVNKIMLFVRYCFMGQKCNLFLNAFAEPKSNFNSTVALKGSLNWNYTMDLHLIQIFPSIFYLTKLIIFCSDVNYSRSSTHRHLSVPALIGSDEKNLFEHSISHPFFSAMLWHTLMHSNIIQSLRLKERLN